MVTEIWLPFFFASFNDWIIAFNVRVPIFACLNLHYVQCLTVLARSVIWLTDVTSCTPTWYYGIFPKTSIISLLLLHNFNFEFSLPVMVRSALFSCHTKPPISFFFFFSQHNLLSPLRWKKSFRLMTKGVKFLSCAF